jgi:hypothetical protein
VLPNYRARAAAGETWALDEDSLAISPVRDHGQSGGLWKVSAVVKSNKSGRIPIMGFAKVLRARNAYPLSMGFFVSDFNAYGIGENF